jgi:hypothetical protein
MTRSKLFAFASLLAAAAISAPLLAQQQPPRPPAGAPQPTAPPTPGAQQPPAGQQSMGQQPAGSDQSGSQDTNEGPPWPVVIVTSVEVLRSHVKGHLEIVRARGFVTSDAWGDPHLLPISQGVPVDGILDLILQAHSPGTAVPLGPFMPVEAILPMEPGSPYKGVRVRGATNAVTLMTLPGYAEAPGYAEGAGPKEDCAKCIGKYFVAKGANPPAGVAADDIVREADLPWPLRVIKPTDGIPSYIYDPNRLTLVLSEDGRIVDGAWD